MVVSPTKAAPTLYNLIITYIASGRAFSVHIFSNSIFSESEIADSGDDGDDELGNHMPAGNI